MQRKAKANVPKTVIREAAAVTYEVHPIAHVFWTAFQSLTQEEQGAFLGKLLDDPKWYEEISDAITMIESENEPTRPFEEFEEELRREKLL